MEDTGLFLYKNYSGHLILLNQYQATSLEVTLNHFSCCESQDGMGGSASHPVHR